MNPRLLLLVLFLVGVPAVVTLVLLGEGSPAEAASASQPGGTVSGTVRDADQRPLWDARVEAWTIDRAGDARRVTETRADHEGVYRVELPAVDGRYELRFEASDQVELRLPFAFSGPGEGPRTVDRVDVEMRPGASLAVEIHRVGARGAASGRWELASTPTSGWFGGLSGPPVQRSGRFERGAFTVDHLPPAAVHLFVQLDTGETIEAELQLTRGPNRHAVDV